MDPLDIVAPCSGFHGLKVEQRVAGQVGRSNGIVEHGFEHTDDLVLLLPFNKNDLRRAIDNEVAIGGQHVVGVSLLHEEGGLGVGFKGRHDGFGTGGPPAEPNHEIVHQIRRWVHELAL